VRRIFIKKCVLFTVGSVCRLTRFATGWQTFRWWRSWNGGAEVTETTVKRYLCCGFRRTGKAMGQEYQCWLRICREISIFFRFKYRIFCVLYPFVTYLPTPSYSKQQPAKHRREAAEVGGGTFLWNVAWTSTGATRHQFSLLLTSCWFLHYLLFYPEDGGCTFLRNVAWTFTGATRFSSRCCLHLAGSCMACSFTVKIEAVRTKVRWTSTGLHSIISQNIYIYIYIFFFFGSWGAVRLESALVRRPLVGLL
jgi:hypothetical protein